jgi:hypothetical protein
VVIYKYDEILSGDESAPSQADYKALDQASTDVDKKKLIVNYKEKSLAYSHLVSSMDMKGDNCVVPIGILKNCRTVDLPSGDAFKAITKLQDYYNDKSVATIQSLLKEYNDCSLKSGQDPSANPADTFSSVFDQVLRTKSGAITAVKCYHLWIK